METTTRYAPRTVRSVAHAAALLHEIAAAPTPPTLSTLARRVGLSKPATYNLVNTLVAERLAVKDAAGRYSIGWSMYELGAAVRPAQAIRDAARAALFRLAAQTKGIALLSVLDNDSVLYIDREESEHAFDMVANTGRRSPLHATASGKVLLANMAAPGIGRYLSRPLKPTTNATITDPHRLGQEISRTKKEGFGVCWGEQEPLLSSVAVRVPLRDTTLQASLAVALTTQRLSTMSPARLAQRLRDAANRVAAGLDRFSASASFAH